MNSDKKADCIVLSDNYVGFPVEHFCTSPRYNGFLDHVLIPNGFIKDRLEKMAMDIVSSYIEKEVASISLMCVLKGSFKLSADLVDLLERTIRARGVVMPISVDFVRVRSYINDISCDNPILTGIDDPAEYRDKNILVVEDIVDTGQTLRALFNYLETLSPKSIQVASLLVKRTKSGIAFRPQYIGFEVPDRFVVGYSLDFNEHFRDLHHIYVINEAGKKAFSVPSK